MTTTIKILRSYTTESWSRYNDIYRAFRVSLFSTGTVTCSASASKDTLYGRIMPFGSPRISILPILDQWAREGRCVEQEELLVIIKKLRMFRRFKHALEVSEWMSNKRYFDLKPRDMAIRLHLISKVHGIEQAEKYFNNIPIPSRDCHVYGALLGCYAHAKYLEKAEGIMQKMSELGFNKTPLNYNVMLKLYAEVGKHEKSDSLMQEMEEKGIPGDQYTFNTRLHEYITSSDLEGMESLLMKMEANHAVAINWNTYALVANGYLKVGAAEKALTMLKKSEKLVKVKKRRFAYEVFLTLYARLGNKSEVCRIWNLFQKAEKIYNMAYFSMISSLAILDDLDGAEKIWEEWEAKKTYYDSRIPYFLVNAYCKKGLVKKAESIVNRVIENGEEPSASMWDKLAIQYHENHQMDKAVETMKKATLMSKSGWKPNLATVAACLEHLKGIGSTEVAVEFIELLKERGHISGENLKSLLDYMKNVNSEFKVFDLMSGDNRVL
ncbi:hypothetical protein NMG60_11035574 [Bertholletia excelsa]